MATSAHAAQQPQDQNKKQEPPFIVRSLALFAGGAILLGGIGMTVGHQHQVDTANVASAAQVEQLRSQLNDLSSTTASTQEDVSTQATGMSPARKSSDDETMQAVMKKALTWSSGEEYIQARQDLIDRWKLDEKSQFLTVFMPGEDAGAWRTDSSGTTYFAYEGINSSLDSFTSSVTNVDGTRYTYFAVVGVKTRSSDGMATDVTYSTMSYTLDANGTISDLTGWAGAPGTDTTYSG